MNHLVWVEIFTVLGTVVTAVLVLRLLREHRPPSSTMAWAIAIILIPYLGVPLYLLLGGRRVRWVKEKKANLYHGETHYRDYILAKMSKRPAIVETVKALEAVGLPPPSDGNSLSFITSGEDAYARLMAMIRSAKKSIYITTFILGRDSVGKDIVDALAQKAAEGVEVKLLLDALGCFKSRWGFVNPIRKAGGEVGIFLPILPIHRKWSTHLRNHRKLVIIDGETAMLGGLNLAKEYMGPTPNKKRWADMAVIIDGPSVTDYQDIFAADWFFTTGRQPEMPEPSEVRKKDPREPGEGALQVVASGPDAESQPLHDAMTIALFKSKKRVWIVTPYFIPDQILTKTLALLGRMGRDVRVIVPRRSNHFVTDLARGAFVRDLYPSNVKFYAYQPGMLHSKLIIIDDDLAIVGSANMDVRSLFLDFEVGAFIYSPKHVKQIAESIVSYMDQSEILGKKDVYQKGLIVETVEDICRLLAPLL